MAKNVTAPRRWRSSPDSPSTQLAYVTQPEIDLLVDANIHGSMKGKPNRGPNGIMSLDGDYAMNWNRPSPSKPSRPPGQPSTGPHIGYGGGQPQPSGGGGGQQGGPGHPGGYNPNLNIAAKTGVIDKNVFTPGSSDDPYGEKGDYMDWDAINQQTGLTVGQTQAGTQLQGERLAKERQSRVKAASDISSAIGTSGTSQQELEYMLSHNTISPKLAVQLGYAKPVMKMTPAGLKPTGSYIDTKTGKPYVPRDYNISSDILTTAGGEAVEDWRKGVLGDIQTAQDEGVYGGVAGIEAETNRQKKIAIDAVYDLKEKGLNPDEIKLELQNHPDFKGLLKMFGDVDTALLNTVGLSGMKGLKFWDEKKLAEFQANPTQTWGDVGYDPTGVHTWSDIESDPVLYEKYLSAGTNWEDPLSGIFNTQGEALQGGQRQGYDYRPRSQRDRNLALLRFLRGGSPARKLEKSGFIESMVDPYAEETRIAGEEGIFSGISSSGISGESMKRLLKSWGSGYTNPRHSNVAARGGIMSAWNNMRR